MLEDTSGNSLNNPSITLVNPLAVTTAEMVIRDDVAFTTSIRIRGHTVSLNTFMTLSIRVCGAETLTLANSAKKNYIFGVETGDTSSMSDSTRYFTISESTFAPWFNLGSSNDPCTVKRYEIYSSLSPLTVWSGNTHVQLTGSIGSYALKIDKTIATNARSVYLRAVTRGLVTATQEIEWVICPRTGGVQVTLPTTVETNILNNPDSSSTLYQQLVHA